MFIIKIALGIVFGFWLLALLDESPGCAIAAVAIASLAAYAC